MACHGRRWSREWGSGQKEDHRTGTPHAWGLLQRSCEEARKGVQQHVGLVAATSSNPLSERPATWLAEAWGTDISFRPAALMPQEAHALTARGARWVEELRTRTLDRRKADEPTGPPDSRAHPCRRALASGRHAERTGELTACCAERKQPLNTPPRLMLDPVEPRGLVADKAPHRGTFAASPTLGPLGRLHKAARARPDLPSRHVCAKPRSLLGSGAPRPCPRGAEPRRQ